MVKLKDLLDECVQDDSEKLINFTRFLKECEVVTSDEGNMYMMRSENGDQFRLNMQTGTVTCIACVSNVYSV